MRKPQRPRASSLVLVATTVVLSLLGLLFVFEASVAEAYNTFGDQYHFLKQHAIGLGLGLLLFLVGLFTPSKTWIQLAPLIGVGALLLMLAVFLPGIGLELNGAHRWIQLGPLTFQAVEMYKFGLICYLAAWFATKHPAEPPLLPFLTFVGLSAVLLLMQPDLGSLLVVTAIAFGMFFLAGGNLKQVGLIGAVTIPALLLLILLSPYRRDRLMTFLNPEADPSGTGYHVRQITLALGRGGLFGQGIGNSNQRFAYIPEASTDSIFAIVAEEIGFVGSSLVIFLYGVFIVLSYKHVQSANDPAIRLLGAGIFLWFSTQVLLNLAAVVALVPLTGITLPFFSYGRSAQVMILFATGILVRIGKSE